MSAGPGYFDLQVNGYAGVDFQSDDLTADDLHRACAALQGHGVAGILATIITAPLPDMERRLRRVVELRAADALAREIIRGIHIEGPFISPANGYRGAHPLDGVRPADPGIMRRLLDTAGGLAKLVTLAPEADTGQHVTRFLSTSGIRVSAGHTDATLDQLRAAIDAGLTMFTHLGNGCPMQMHRHDNIIQRVLSLADQLTITFIADGAHVPFPALGNYLKLADINRCIVVTDAVAPAGMGPGRFRLGHWDFFVGDDLVARAPDGSHLLGSAITMPLAVDRLIKHVGLTPAQAQRLTVDNPRSILG